MDEKRGVQGEEFEIDIRRIFNALIARIWLIVITCILGILTAFLVTFFFVTPLYKSSAMFYVNNADISVGGISASISSGDIVASKSLVDSYIVILKTRTTLMDVIEYSGVNRTYPEVYAMISAAAVNDTEIFEIVVTSSNPKEAESIANAIAYVLPKKISSIIDGTSAKVVEYAIIPTVPSSPSYTKNIALGGLIGFILSAGFIALREIFDITIRNAEDIEQICKYPILAEVPDMSAPSKGGYYSNGKKKYGYGYGRGYSKGNQVDTKLEFFGENMSFAASEAYKLLRTKVQFSFADENDCHVICTTSAFSGEGKSLSAINLAASLSQLDKKVILVDCDLRRPSVAKKLQLTVVPGLSDYLTRNVESEEIIRHFSLGENINFDVIPGGRIPPNPMELLSSARMEKITSAFKDSYDYVIFDLPPIEEVGDALVAAKLADGVIMVVRQDHCNRLALDSSIKQLEFLEAKIIGIVFNAIHENSFARKYYYYYGNKYYNKRYYGKRYYENSYEAGADKAKAEEEARKKEPKFVIRKRSHKESDEE